MPKKITEVKSKGLRLMQLGESGSGKSHRAADATRWGRVYFFDFDGKIDNLTRSGVLKPEQLALIEYDTWEDTAAASKFADELLKSNPYQTVVIDTSSTFNNMVEREMRAKNKVAVTAKSSYEEWAAVLNICRDFFENKILRLNCNVIINSHVKVREQMAGEEKLDAAGAGSYAITIKNLMSDSQYLFSRLGKPVVQVSKNDKIAINSPVDPKFVTPNGTLTVSDLSVFDGVAIKVSKV